MPRAITLLLCLFFVCSAACAGDYVYVVPYRYQMPNIMYSYDYDYRTGNYNPYYDGSLYRRSLICPPIYNILDDSCCDDDHGYMVDPYGGIWFFYK